MAGKGPDVFLLECTPPEQEETNSDLFMNLEKSMETGLFLPLDEYIENAKYIFGNMKNIGDEMEFKEGGIVRTRARQVLDKAIELLEQLTSEGLFNALEKGIFADIKRSRVGGKGLDGVVEKGANYMNPFINLLKGRK